MSYNRDNPSKFNSAAVAIPRIADNFEHIKDVLEEFTGYAIGETHAYGWYADATVLGSSYGTAAASYCLMPKPLALEASPNAADYLTGQFYYDSLNFRYLYCSATMWNPSISATISLPASTTQNYIVRFDGTSGATIQSSAVKIENDGEIKPLNIVTFNKQLIVDQVLNSVSDQSKVSGIYLFDKYGSETYLSDRTPYSGHTAHNINIVDNNLNQVQAKNCSPEVEGLCRVLSCDTTHAFNINDHNDFSFVESSVDNSFTIIMLIKPTFGIFNVILSKYYTDTSLRDERDSTEWLFYVLGNHIYFNLYKDISNYLTSIALAYSATGDNSEWHVYAVTYDGSGDENNLKIYSDGVQINDTNIETGTYTHTQNTNSKVATYMTEAGLRTGYLDAYIGFISIIKERLDGTDINRISNLLLRYVGESV